MIYLLIVHISIFVYSLKYIKENNFKKYFIGCLLAASKNVIKSKLGRFWKQIAVDFISILLIFFVAKLIHIEVSSYLSWIALAIIYAFIAGAIVFIINILLYHSQVRRIIRRVTKH